MSRMPALAIKLGGHPQERAKMNTLEWVCFWIGITVAMGYLASEGGLWIREKISEGKKFRKTRWRD